MAKEVLFESEDPWLFELDCFLEDRDLETTDVTEIIMMVKDNPDDVDGNALVTKTLTLSECAFVGTDAVTVQITAADYGASAMEIGGTYYVYLGFTATGYTSNYLEAPTKVNTVTILQDGMRS